MYYLELKRTPPNQQCFLAPISALLRQQSTATARPSFPFALSTAHALCTSTLLHPTSLQLFFLFYTYIAVKNISDMCDYQVLVKTEQPEQVTALTPSKDKAFTETRLNPRSVQKANAFRSVAVHQLISQAPISLSWKLLSHTGIGILLQDQGIPSMCGTYSTLL